MINRGIVTSINGNLVKIKLFKSSSCSHCSCCSESSKYGKDFEFRVDGKVQMGDLITLEMAEKDVIKAAFIAYIVPPIFLILGYIFASYLNFSESKCILASFIGLIIAFIFLFMYDKLFAKKNIEDEIKIISIEKFDPTNAENQITSCDI